jgi:FlaA1/EpsC-like NDP-sugar epimerase
VSEPRLHTKALRRVATASLVIADWMVVLLSTNIAYWVRFEGSIPKDFSANAPYLAAAALVVYTAALAGLKLYRQVWRYAGVDVLIRLSAAAAGGTVVLLVFDVLVPRLDADTYLRPWPLSVVFALGVLVFLGTSALRLLPRTILYLRLAGSDESVRNVIIVGAGDAGSLLLRDIEQQPELGVRVIGFLDDDRTKHRRAIRGVNVLGPVSALHDIAEQERIDEVFVAMPSVSQDVRRRVLDICVREGVATRVIGQLTSDGHTIGVGDLRSVKLEDLLGREPVEIDVEAVAETIRDRTVAVTGAAGSIGSELCRQLASMSPGCLVLIDVDESRLYDLDQEMRRLGVECVSLSICDIRDLRKTTAVLDSTKPDLLFHAAAYKHVPLMELAPDEAVKANVLGTRNVLQACRDAHVARFVLISTDKAVHPSTVMGRTKAITEQLMIRACQQGWVRASAVRFGNVLGSRGSVVPLFEEQLRAGGPLTVTHPDVTRFFMTIPEAARLVLQAQALSEEGGEIFVLEMGQPVKIADVARRMIVLSGATVEIEYTGLRPAEKLHEVLVHDAMELLPTGATKIMKANALPILPRSFDSDVQTLIDCAVDYDVDRLPDKLEGLIPAEEPA